MKKNVPGQPVAAVTKYILLDQYDNADSIIFNSWDELSNHCIEHAEMDGQTIEDWMDGYWVHELGPSVPFECETKMTLTRAK